MIPEEVEINEIVLARAKELIVKYSRLDIIYLRVSTKNMGQEEKDQMQDIIQEFQIEKKHCLVLAVKESAYQLKKQKNRRFNDIIKLLNLVDQDIPKRCFFWSIDRIYRNRELLEEFYYIADKTNTKIYSYMESFINTLAEMRDKLPEGMEFIIDMQVKQLVNFFGWMAEMESKKRGERLSKSLHVEEGKLITNKGNVFGNKLKLTNGKIIEDIKEIIKIEEAVIKLIKKNTPYRKIILLASKMNIKLSMGYISNLKHRNLNRETY